MKPLTSAIFALAVGVAADTAIAAPLCDAFSSPDAMPKKYKKLAPVLAGNAQDWIITQDQMDTEYEPGKRATALLNEIVKEFEARGTKLAIMMPPPRPLVAGQAKMDELLAASGEQFDVAAVSASFNSMVETLRSSGAIAPNLLSLATSTPELQDDFFYRHDTHWTPGAAAESAYALAENVVDANLPAFQNAVLTRPEVTADSPVFEELGSLAKMADAVCGAQIDAVVRPIPVFAGKSDDLFGDSASGLRVILAGSSFSNRRKFDAYRVADAIAGALGADVANHSVSGGGAIGALEGVVLTGKLDANDPVDLVVWELPYTEGMRNVSILRQMLGALRYDASKSPAKTIAFKADGETKLDLSKMPADLMALKLPNAEFQRLKIDLKFEDGSKTTLTPVRKKHVTGDMRADVWAISLTGFSKGKPVSAKLRYDASKLGSGASIEIFESNVTN